MGLILRPIFLTEAKQVSQFVNSAYRGERAQQTWTSEASFLGGQRVDPEMILDMGTTLGQAILRNSEDPLQCCGHIKIQGATAWLGMITVDVERQGKGLGRHLLHALEDHAVRTWASRVARMHVISIRNELIAWYMRRGYRPTTERQSFPYGNPRFGEPLKQGLEFIVLEKLLTPS